MRVGVDRKVASVLVGKTRHLWRKVHTRRVAVDLQSNAALGGFPEHQLEVVRRTLPRARPAASRMADHIDVRMGDRAHHAFGHGGGLLTQLHVRRGDNDVKDLQHSVREVE